MNPVQEALGRTKVSGQPVTAKVDDELFIRVRVQDGEVQIACYTSHGPATDLQAATVADLAAWTSYEQSVVQRALLLTELPVLPGTVLVPGSCGTCAHGIPGQYPNEVGCTLGWEAHDRLWDSGARGRKAFGAPRQTTMGHGGLPLPISTPDASCGARVAGRLGYAGRT